MSPFKSTAQRKWMYSQKPAMAKRWEAETPKGKKLPKHVASGMTAKSHKRSMAAMGKKMQKKVRSML